MSLIKLEDVYKSFSDKNEKLEILKGINFTVSKNEIVSITGESGSGKSTLLYIMGFLDNPDSGKISYNSTEMKLSNKVKRQHVN